METSTDSVDLRILKSVANKANTTFQTVPKNMGRGLLAAVTATVLLILPLLGTQPENVSVPFLNIELPFTVASVVFWILSFSLGISAALRYRSVSQMYQTIANNINSLSPEEQDSYYKYFYSLNIEYSLLMRLPGILLTLTAFPLHVLPAMTCIALLFCFPQAGTGCKFTQIAIFSFLVGLISASPYYYLGLKSIYNWISVREAIQSQ